MVALPIETSRSGIARGTRHAAFPVPPTARAPFGQARRNGTCMCDPRGVTERSVRSVEDRASTGVRAGRAASGATRIRSQLRGAEAVRDQLRPGAAGDVDGAPVGRELGEPVERA